MALINCPECNKEISDQAPACVGCGAPLTSEPVIAATEKTPVDNSKINFYRVTFKNGHGYYDTEDVQKATEEAARVEVIANNPECEITQIQTIPAANSYSCPSCKSRYSYREKSTGMAFFVMVFFSLGLGLIMLPFLPYHCQCLICNYKWKA